MAERRGVIIAGTRTITDASLIAKAVKECGFVVDEIVCGGATGVDQLGKKYAEARDIPLHMFPADWNTYGTSAGPRRNAHLAKFARALILLWDGESRGSASMLQEATAAGIPVFQLRV